MNILWRINKKNLTLDSKIDECGIDSINFAELCFELEDKYDITIGNIGKVSRSQASYKVSNPATSESLTVGGIVEYIRDRVN